MLKVVHDWAEPNEASSSVLDEIVCEPICQVCEPLAVRGRDRSRRQLGERTKAKGAQEVGGRGQEGRPSATAEAWVILDQAAREQRLDHATTVGATDVADLGPGDVLLVSNDRQHFQRRLRQRFRGRLLQKALDQGPAVGCRDQLDTVVLR